MKKSAVVVVVGVCLASHVAVARVVTLRPSRDNTLYQDAAGALSNGSGKALFVGQNADGDLIHRALLAFDLVGRVPPGSQIHSAVLTLHMDRASSGAQVIYLHKVLAPWGEGSSSTDQERGARAASGDATWIHSFYPNRTWSQPGGDYEPAVSTACEVNEVGHYTWGPAARMTRDIQQWVDNPASNFGWMLIGEETSPKAGKRFDSREVWPDRVQPALTIHFTPGNAGAPPVDGDLSGDRHVDFDDLALIAGQWLTGAPESATTGTITIAGVGEFTFDPKGILSMRPDIFQPGHCSAFDVLAHLDRQDLIDMAYHFDSAMATHVIDSINGVSNWWYRAHYDGGRLVDVATRMDLYPCKEKMEISVEQIDEALLEQIYASFAGEVRRKAATWGQVIIPEVTILGKSFQHTFKDVVVRPHDLRIDTFREGVITAVDVILSLADQGKLTCDLQWYDSIGAARVVRSFWVFRINDDALSGRAGFQYETGADRSLGKANRIGMPSDWRVLVSPTYMQWNWADLN